MKSWQVFLTNCFNFWCAHFDKLSTVIGTVIRSVNFPLIFGHHNPKGSAENQMYDDRSLSFSEDRPLFILVIKDLEYLKLLQKFHVH